MDLKTAWDMAEKMRNWVRMCEVLATGALDPEDPDRKVLHRARLAHKVVLGLAILPQKLSILGGMLSENYDRAAADVSDAAAAEWRMVDQGVLARLLADIFAESEKWMEARVPPVQD